MRGVDGKRQSKVGNVTLAGQDRSALAGLLQHGEVGAVRGMPGVAEAWLAVELAGLARGMVIVVAESSRALEVLASDVASVGAGRGVRTMVLPAVNGDGLGLRARSRAGRGEAEGARMVGLKACLDWQGKGLLLTCVQSLLEPAPRPEGLRKECQRLRLGEEHDLETLCERLAAMGYSFEAEVLVKGQASRRGGVLDVWVPADEWPMRLEFFGDVIDGMRRFDPATQRSVSREEAVEIAPAGLGTESGTGEPGDVLAYLPKDAAFVWLDPDGLLRYFAMSQELAKGVGGRGSGAEKGEEEESVWRGFTNWRMGIRQRFTGGQLDVGGREDVGGFAAAAPGTAEMPHGGRDLGIEPFAGIPALAGRSLPVDVLERERQELVEELRARVAAGWRVVVRFETEAGARRFAKVHGDGAGGGGLELAVGGVSGSAEWTHQRTLWVAEADVYGTRKDTSGRRQGSSRAVAVDATGERLASWTDLRPGELVVHVQHGIGKYLGLFEIRFDGELQEVLAVEYAEGARLYVPADQAHLLSRYVGVGHAKPPLHALGGHRWLRERKAAERAASDLAAQMLQTQAKRAAMPGHAFAADTPWQRDFEDAFPYVETPDQAAAIAAVKRDMEAPRPMDRLVCGDTGYGKTEVAMRAAFKAVMDGRQVAVLVPTTVLAQQHYETFLARMGRFPISVELLSRARSRLEAAEVLKRAAEGKVDVLVGTHRLLQRDVSLPRLGLVIIDEEQRFGVEAKEHLKRMRASVDVLTLTATPIPRTLYLSLVGARDLSVIQTAPRERLAIETYVAQDDDGLVREAILRELSRGGQVFFLHNRVQTLDAMRGRLKALVPSLRILVAHGQMPETRLAAIIRDFAQRKADLLLCTTIIESGVDMPNVNTILIDRADRFGMADLYQIRGRVGRSPVQAYAYLLLPRHLSLFREARERIAAIRRHSSLGAGYKLALRDLEIRGAGNVLGAAQSGHIAAVGFGLYCQLLERTVAQMQGRKPRPIVDVRVRLPFLSLSPAPVPEEGGNDEAHAPPPAAIPRDFVTDEAIRIEMYRRLSSLAFLPEVDALEAEWRDRFGPLPPAVRRTLDVARLRVRAAALGVKSVIVEGDRLVLATVTGHYLMPNHRHPRLHRHAPDERLAEILRVLEKLTPSGAQSQSQPQPPARRG